MGKRRAIQLDPRFAHAWDVTPREAMAIQLRLRAELVLTDVPPGAVHHVAGVDVGFEDRNHVTRAAVAVLTYPDLVLAEYAIARRPTSFPYVPGLLSFREVPAILDALAALRQVPDLLLCDGQGYAHPRRFGIACHLGLLTGLPAIGVGKSRLVGEHDEPPTDRGAWVPLHDRGEVVGAVLRSRAGVKPIYVSVGHRVGLEQAVAYVMACTTRYRLPETTRWAHRLASGPPLAAHWRLKPRPSQNRVARSKGGTDPGRRVRGQKDRSHK